MALQDPGGDDLDAADGEIVDDEDATGEIALVGASFSAPLPPPAMLREYNEVLPGLAERIVTMAERDQQHVHKMDRRYMISRFTGQASAFVIAMSGLGAGTVLIATGRQIEGLAALIIGIGPIAGAFLYRQIKITNAVTSDETQDE